MIVVEGAIVNCRYDQEVSRENQAAASRRFATIRAAKREPAAQRTQDSEQAGHLALWCQPIRVRMWL